MVDQVATAPCTDPIQVRFLLLSSVRSVRAHVQLAGSKTEEQFPRYGIATVNPVEYPGR